MRYSIKIIFALLFIFSYQLSHAACMDSVGVEKKNGKTYIQHKVGAKETLYSISRQYNVSVAEITGANPEAKAGINIGEIILVPYKGKTKETPTPKQAEGSGVGKVHTVAPKETLYGIARMYNVTVDELNKANPDIAKDGLQIDQEVMIPSKNSKINTSPTTAASTNAVAATRKPQATAMPEEKPKPTEDEDKSKTEPSDEETTVANNVKKNKTALSPAPATGYKKINESGTAMLMTSTSEDLKYLALHKTAPIGTIIQVRNDDTEQKIFVRVVGKIPSVSEKSILKLSPKAFERLGGKGEQIPVSISYIP